MQVLGKRCKCSLLGESQEVVATCGGKIICLIDCHTGMVLKRYKDSSKSEVSAKCLVQCNKDTSNIAVILTISETLLYHVQFLKPCYVLNNL